MKYSESVMNANCGKGIVMLPKFRSDFWIESHNKIQELERSLLKVNLDDFEDINHYELERYQIKNKLGQEKSRYRSDLQDGLDEARIYRDKYKNNGIQDGKV